MSKLHIKKGDIVYVNAGEDKGKTGRVLEMLVKEKRAIVEGLTWLRSIRNPMPRIHKADGRRRRHRFIFRTSIRWIPKQENRHAWAAKK